MNVQMIVNADDYGRSSGISQGIRAAQFYTSFYDTAATTEEILRLIAVIGGQPAGTVHEVMCHPGYVDAELAASTVYNYQRTTELAVLTDEVVRQAVAGQPIALVSFAALA